MNHDAVVLQLVRARMRPMPGARYDVANAGRGSVGAGAAINSRNVSRQSRTKFASRARSTSLAAPPAGMLSSIQRIAFSLAVLPVYCAVDPIVAISVVRPCRSMNIVSP